MPVSRRAALCGLMLCLGAPFFTGCQTAKPTDPALAISTGPSPDVQFAIDRISPAVVRIDFTQDVFESGSKQTLRAIGSGVIIDPQGHVLTNFHVAGRAKQLQVTLADQEHVGARLIGSDHWTDLAVIQLDLAEVKQKGITFQSAPLGDSDAIQLGEPVMAVGTPFGLTRTLTKGIVSNTDRYTADTTIDGYETGWFNNWIQTDAAINPGNSGGPLINLRGEVVGINSKGITAANEIGFAIPSNTAKYVVASILAHGKVNRSYIGVEIQPLEDLNSYYDVANDRGVLVRSVDPDSPASRAGVEAEDILLAVNNTPVVARFPEQIASVRRLIANTPIGSTLTLTFQRGSGKKVEQHTVTMQSEKLESVVTIEHAITELGATVRDVTRSYLRAARLPMVQGVIITSIRDGSPAQEAKLLPDDIITRVNNRQVIDADDLEAQMRRLTRAGKTILIDVQRDRSVITVAVKLNN